MTNTLNDVRYWTYHDSNKPTAVFIHGFTGSHEGFQYIIPELADFHIIVPDLPGFGESKLGLDEFAIDELARKVNHFVAGLKLKQPPYLVSHSMGGLVAASMLSQNPELFDTRTVFVSPVATKVNYLDVRKIGELFGRLQFYIGKAVPKAGPRIVTSRLISRMATSVIMTTTDRPMKKVINGHHFKNLDNISSIDYYYQLHKDINKKGTLDYALALSTFDVLLVVGDKDNVTPLATEKQLQAATGADMTIIQGVGHLLHYERPKEVAAAIDVFLKS